MGVAVGVGGEWERVGRGGRGGGKIVFGGKIDPWASVESSNFGIQSTLHSIILSTYSDVQLIVSLHLLLWEWEWEWQWEGSGRGWGEGEGAGGGGVV